MIDRSVIENEDDLIYLFITRYRWPPDIYPKVTTIAKERISPDIDILMINRGAENDTVIGYEMKVISLYHGHPKWRVLYEGIGEMLSYFKYGVDKSYLVISPSSVVNEDQRKKIHEKIREVAELFKNLVFQPKPIIKGDRTYNFLLVEKVKKRLPRFGFHCIGIMWFDLKDLYKVLKAEDNFPSELRSENMNLRRMNLIHKQIGYENNFIKKYSKRKGKSYTI